MSFKVNETAEGSTVFLNGEIDLDRSPAARKLLLAAVGRSKPVAVDLSEVSYMDSSGIASLVEAFQKARSTKTEFALVRVSAAVMKVLTLARLDKIFTVRSTA
jgi:anti-sigma B factor antagonist